MKYGWLGVVMLALSGCALVGFDDGDDGLLDDGPGGDEQRDDKDGGMDASQTGSGDPETDAGADAGHADAAADASDIGEDEDAGETCQEGSKRCDSGFFIECKEGVERMVDCSERSVGACEIAVCDPLEGCRVMNAPETTSCDDGKDCTVGDSCVAGDCVPGDPRDCTSHDGVCTIGACNEELGGECESVPNPEATICGDGGLICSDGQCISGDLCMGGCTLACSVETGPCSFKCNGSEVCSFACEENAICNFDCSGALDNCGVTCAAGSKCTVQCATPEDCLDVVCAPGADCETVCAEGVCPEPQPPG